jgi:hypothetical protein
MSAVFCSIQDCVEVCDFCRYFDYNGAQAIYIGNGACWHPDHIEPCDPGDGCDDFHCGLSAEPPERRPIGIIALGPHARAEEGSTK